ncbi:MAG: hypothetical protein JXR76_29850 [Deltaproteobacteria bacterium]|nr:hypothetical protein [Deltaproteobacteria bacterium]
MHHLNVRYIVLFSSLAFAISSCSCDDKECKSSRDCGMGEVCRNGKCISPEVSTASDSATDSSSATGSDSISDSNASSDSTTDSDTTQTGTDSTSDSATATVACFENWECNDDNSCTTDVCQNGQCTHSQTTPLPAGCCRAATDCNDGDNCTTDTCNPTTFACQYTSVADGTCCTANSDCNDGNTCTLDACGFDGRCVHAADLSGTDCCDDVYDCNVSACASMACTSYQCVATFPATLPAGCCAVASDCPPGEGACAVASCNSMGECEYETNPALSPDCCMTAADCDDGNSCNLDSCTFEYMCAHSAPISPAPGCCLNDGDCADGDNCTADLCIDNVCTTGIPNPLPVGCCNDATDCDDLNDCTREVCSNGHCYSAGDPLLGAECCYELGDCDDGNACTQDSCSTFSSQCRHAAPDTDSMPDGCCLVAADCTDTDPCMIGSCASSPQFNCQFAAAVDDTPCDNASWCDGPEVCIGGVCQSKADGNPCTGPASVCREVDCVEPATVGGIGSCTIIAEYDTDSACDDGIYCNGNDICLAGDCVHVNTPCVGLDTDSLGICKTYTCNETTTSCLVANKPNFTSCDNALKCDGVNLCVNGVCEAGSYCGAGNDCLTYSCIEDTAGGTPTCVENLEPNGKSCATPDLGACFGNSGRMCLDGSCSIGDNPLCSVTAATNGFCTETLCVEAWDTDGCFVGTFDPADTSSDTDNPSPVFTSLGCAIAADTDSGDAYLNTVVFSTAYEQNRVSNYGGLCGSGFDGGDLIYQIDLVDTQNYTFTITNLETTMDTTAYDVSIMLLTDACNSASCVVIDSNSATASINYTATTTGTHYIVIDTSDRQYVTGALTVTCN